ncbi:MAG: RsmB/NOP family class I SAM-dependent RNA methyltransferase [Rhodospirillaceae bacterium]
MIKDKSNKKSAVSPAGDGASRAAALQLLQAVLHNHRSIDDAFDAAARGLEPRDRAFVRLLVATTLRRIGQIDGVLMQFVSKQPPDAVTDLLRLGAAQLLFLGTAPHAAVATTVDLVKAKYGRLSGLVNAVMRRVADQGPALVAAQDAARLNTPDWLWDSWVATYGEPAARATAEAHLIEAPLDLSLKDPASSAVWAERLGGTVLPTGSLRLPKVGKVQELAGFADGDWWVQDAAAALPAKVLLHALSGRAAQHIGDICAAPGGKSAQLAAAGHTVTAVDVSAQRLGLMTTNLKRLKLDVRTVTADARTWRPDQLFDGLLLDAPCSATGTIRRHPDLPYLKRPTDLDAFVRLQAALLAAAVAMVKPGAPIVYSVCSLQPEERKAVVDAVMETSNLSRQKIPAAALSGESQFITPDGELRTLPSQWPERGGLDGFYGVLLQRTV